MSTRLEVVELPEDITAKLWINNETGLVNSSVVRFEQDGDVFIVATLPTIDKIIELLTKIRDDALETVRLDREAKK